MFKKGHILLCELNLFLKFVSNVIMEYLVAVISIVVAVVAMLLFMRPIQEQSKKEVPEDKSKSLTAQIQTEETGNTSKENQVLSASIFRPFHILEIIDVSYNTKLIRLEIPFGKS